MKNLLKYRDLLWQLALRDIKLQYQRPFLGFLWMLIIPFSTAIIYKILFSDFFRISSKNYPFFIHLITALLPWNYFASSIQRANRCILESRNIVNRIRVPLYLLPAAAVLVNLINFLPTLIILFGFLIGFKVQISMMIIFLPFVILIHSIMILGISFAVAGLQVIYRDVEYAVQIALMTIFFLTPSVYTFDEIAGRVSPALIKIYMLNPFTGILNLYRAVLIKGYVGDLSGYGTFLNMVINPLLWGVVFILAGYMIFKACEKRFFDFINI